MQNTLSNLTRLADGEYPSSLKTLLQFSREDSLLIQPILPRSQLYLSRLSYVLSLLHLTLSDKYVGCFRLEGGQPDFA